MLPESSTRCANTSINLEEADLLEDQSEIRTIFKYIGINLHYSSTCLTNLKVLELGSSHGENLLLALNHGASFVAGLERSQSSTDSSNLIFRDAEIIPNKYFFCRANIFSLNSCELNIPSFYQHFFDKVFSCWGISQAKSLQEVKEMMKIVSKYLKPNGDALMIFANPMTVENFPLVKDLPRTENFVLEEVEKIADHFRIRARILQSFDQEDLEVFYNVFLMQDLEEVVERTGMKVKKTGPLQVWPNDESTCYPFDMITKEISKEVSLGCFMHIKKCS
jgi:hypothetical protein